MVDQVVVVDLELQDRAQVILQQEEQEILPLKIHPHHPFKVTLVDLEPVTNKVAAAVVVLQQLEPMLIQMLVQVVLDYKTILMVTIFTGPVVAVVVLTVTLVEMVELAVAVVVELKPVVVQLELVVGQQKILEEMELHQVHQVQQEVMVETILVVVAVVLVITILMLEMVDPV